MKVEEETIARFIERAGAVAAKVTRVADEAAAERLVAEILAAEGAGHVGVARVAKGIADTGTCVVETDDEETIEKGIQAMEAFYHRINMPVNLRELGVSPTAEQIAFMAASCEEKAGGANGQVVPLKKEDMVKIYTMAL